jgi:uncharacterized protein YkwD
MALHGTKRLAFYLLGAALLFSSVVALLVAPAANSAPSRVRVKAVAPLNGQILREMNRVRRAHGLATLKPSSRLTAAAASHSRAMATKGFFAHSSTNGSVFWKRIARFYPTGDHRYWEVGENLVWQASELSAKQAVRRWMKSPPHRVNLLKPGWREIGLAAVHSPSAPGAYKNMAVTIVTADFGVRS